MLIEQPEELAERLFPKINACFIARDKGGTPGVQANRETFFRECVAAPALRPHLAVDGRRL
jgi:hypothetical protein